MWPPSWWSISWFSVSRNSVHRCDTLCRSNSCTDHWPCAGSLKGRSWAIDFGSWLLWSIYPNLSRTAAVVKFCWTLDGWILFLKGYIGDILNGGIAAIKTHMVPTIVIDCDLAALDRHFQLWAQQLTGIRHQPPHRPWPSHGLHLPAMGPEPTGGIWGEKPSTWKTVGV